MRALLLNGALGDDDTIATLHGVLESGLAAAGWETDPWFLHDTDIAPCRSCYSCWTTTPGECTTDDDGRRLAAAVVQSDPIVALTPVTFGGYSSQLKKALDRLIPDVSPLFLTVDGETHHVPRYESYPDLLIVGTIPLPDAEAERVFLALAARNAINFHARRHAAVVLADGAPRAALELRARSLLDEMGVRPPSAAAGPVADAQSGTG